MSKKNLCKFITLYGTFLCDVVNVNRRRRFSQFLSLNIDTIIKNPTAIQAPVVQTLDSAIHRITNHYPLDGAIGFPNTYPLDSDLSGDSAIHRLINRGQKIRPHLNKWNNRDNVYSLVK